MIQVSPWIFLTTGALWLCAGLGLAWLFGGACRLGGPDDPRLRKGRPVEPAAGIPTTALQA